MKLNWSRHFRKYYLNVVITKGKGSCRLNKAWKFGWNVSKNNTSNYFFIKHDNVSIPNRNCNKIVAMEIRKDINNAIILSLSLVAWRMFYFFHKSRAVIVVSPRKASLFVKYCEVQKISHKTRHKTSNPSNATSYVL